MKSFVILVALMLASLTIATPAQKHAGRRLEHSHAISRYKRLLVQARPYFSWRANAKRPTKAIVIANLLEVANAGDLRDMASAVKSLPPSNENGVDTYFMLSLLLPLVSREQPVTTPTIRYPAWRPAVRDASRARKRNNSLSWSPWVLSKSGKLDIPASYGQSLYGDVIPIIPQLQQAAGAGSRPNLAPFESQRQMKLCVGSSY